LNLIRNTGALPSIIIGYYSSERLKILLASKRLKKIGSMNCRRLNDVNSQNDDGIVLIVRVLSTMAIIGIKKFTKTTRCKKN